MKGNEQKRRIRMILEYMGTRYAGWQWQDNAVTIQQVVEEALGKITSLKSRITASGRTDAGVHALNQPAHADVETRMSDEEIMKAMNAVLPDDISVKEIKTVPEDWSARFSAKEKTYRYTILNRVRPSVFEHGRVWHIKKTLEIDAMRKAASLLVGEHDFTSFRSSGCAAKNPVRRLTTLDIDRDDDTIRLTFTANGFLKQMVRNIVGTLVEAGRGKIAPDDVSTILGKRDRTEAGPCAPPYGLCLVDVVYDNN
ncbi:tRNA pseudouridine(38-40) synthase [hydrothermal vent metagenome]|uniref:tRNA pseudouridine(38-40) synthase n=1 Tax=hydrothermal vent metagenome TaxID=652676 RepID=A0A3B1C9G6_9ZZZZ